MASDEAALSPQEIRKMKVQELREALSNRGLETTGKKDTLIERLEEAVQQQSSGTAHTTSQQQTEVQQQQQQKKQAASQEQQQKQQHANSNTAEGQQDGDTTVGEAHAGANDADDSIAGKDVLDEERVQERAKRFGVEYTPPSELEKRKREREQRFGLAQSDEEERKAKDRAARFDSEPSGANVDTSDLASVPGMSDTLEQQQRKKQRMERFGSGAA